MVRDQGHLSMCICAVSGQCSWSLSDSSHWKYRLICKIEDILLLHFLLSLPLTGKLSSKLCGSCQNVLMGEIHLQIPYFFPLVTTVRSLRRCFSIPTHSICVYRCFQKYVWRWCHNPLKLVVVSVVNRPSQQCEGTSYMFLCFGFFTWWWIKLLLKKRPCVETSMWVRIEMNAEKNVRNLYCLKMEKP